MPYFWFEWAQDDKLSQICRYTKNVPRGKCIKFKWKISNCICECSRCKCCYQKQNHIRTCVPRKRTTKKKYYKLWKGGEIQEKNGRDHITILENIDDKGRFLYIHGGWNTMNLGMHDTTLSIKILKP